MTVRELIEQLQAYPQDANVWLCFAEQREVARLETSVLLPRPCVVLGGEVERVELRATSSFVY